MEQSTTYISRQTGTPVTVTSAEAAGLDPCDGECKWYTICEVHDAAVGHRTKALARSHAADPMGWCEGCAPPQPQSAWWLATHSEYTASAEVKTCDFSSPCPYDPRSPQHELFHLSDQIRSMDHDDSLNGPTEQDRSIARDRQRALTTLIGPDSARAVHDARKERDDRAEATWLDTQRRLRGE